MDPHHQPFITSSPLSPSTSIHRLTFARLILLAQPGRGRRERSMPRAWNPPPPPPRQGATFYEAFADVLSVQATGTNH